MKWISEQFDQRDPETLRQQESTSLDVAIRNVSRDIIPLTNLIAIYNNRLEEVKFHNPELVKQLVSHIADDGSWKTAPYGVTSLEQKEILNQALDLKDLEIAHIIMQQQNLKLYSIDVDNILSKCISIYVNSKDKETKDGIQNIITSLIHKHDAGLSNEIMITVPDSSIVWSTMGYTKQVSAIEYLQKSTEHQGLLQHINYEIDAKQADDLQKIYAKIAFDNAIDEIIANLINGDNPQIEDKLLAITNHSINYADILDRLLSKVSRDFEIRTIRPVNEKDYNKKIDAIRYLLLDKNTTYKSSHIKTVVKTKNIQLLNMFLEKKESLDIKEISKILKDYISSYDMLKNHMNDTLDNESVIIVQLLKNAGAIIDTKTVKDLLINAVGDKKASTLFIYLLNNKIIEQDISKLFDETIQKIYLSYFNTKNIASLIKECNIKCNKDTIKKIINNKEIELIDAIKNQITSEDATEYLTELLNKSYISNDDKKIAEDLLSCGAKITGEQIQKALNNHDADLVRVLLSPQNDKKLINSLTKYALDKILTSYSVSNEHIQNLDILLNKGAIFDPVFIARVLQKQHWQVAEKLLKSKYITTNKEYAKFVEGATKILDKINEHPITYKPESDLNQQSFKDLLSKAHQDYYKTQTKEILSSNTSMAQTTQDIVLDYLCGIGSFKPAASNQILEMSHQGSEPIEHAKQIESRIHYLLTQKTREEGTANIIMEYVGGRTFLTYHSRPTGIPSSSDSSFRSDGSIAEGLDSSGPVAAGSSTTTTTTTTATTTTTTTTYTAEDSNIELAGEMPDVD